MMPTCQRCGAPKARTRRPLCHVCAGTAGHPRRAPNDRDLAMGRMYASGLTMAEVGTAFGVSRERVRQLLTKHTTVKRRSPHPTKDWDDLGVRRIPTAARRRGGRGRTGGGVPNPTTPRKVLNND